MLDDIEAGRVSTVYAYAEDRLARDVEASVRLLNACERHPTHGRLLQTAPNRPTGGVPTLGSREQQRAVPGL